jgi:hypothetical protein
MAGYNTWTKDDDVIHAAWVDDDNLIIKDIG